MGRIIPKENGMITMRDLLHCGLISQIQDGVKILSNVRTRMTISIRDLLIEKSRFNYPIFPYFMRMDSQHYSYRTNCRYHDNENSISLPHRVLCYLLHDD